MYNVATYIAALYVVCNVLILFFFFVYKLEIYH